MPRTRTRRKLALEHLEAREVPAAFTWTQTAPGAYNWNDDANWSGTGVPNSTADTADLTAALAGNQTISLQGANFTVASLAIGSAAPANGTFTILAGGAGGRLTLDAPAGPATLTKTNAGTDAVLAPIALNGGLTLTSSAGNVVLGGDITGTGTITTTGSISWLGNRTLGTGLTIGGTGVISSPQQLFATSAFDADSGAKLGTLVAPNTSTLLIFPAATAIGPDGNLYIAGQFNPASDFSFQGAILKFDLTTYTLGTFISADQLNAARTGIGNTNAVFAPSGLTFGPDGDLYVSLSGGQASGGNGAVVRFDVTAGAYAGTFTDITAAIQVSGGLIQPNGLSFGIGADNTSLYVSEVGLYTIPPSTPATGGQVRKIANATTGTPAVGNFSTFIAAAAANPPTIPTFNFAAGSAWGPDGNFYVVDLGATSNQGAVLQYDAAGNFITNAAPQGQFLFPSGIAFDASGRLLVANLGPAGSGSMPSVSLLGSITRYSPLQTVVASSVFPNTGANGSPPPDNESGFAPSDIEVKPAGAVTIPSGAAVDPGTTGVPGALTFGTLTFAAGSTFVVDISGGAADELVATGPLALGGATLAVNVGGAVAPGTVFTLASGTTLTGTFNGVANNSLQTYGGQQFRVNYTATEVTLTRVAAPVITSGNAATFYTGGPFSFTVTATGFPAPTFAVTAGVLPAGVTLSAGGVLSGTATQTGTFPVTITASNGVAPNATQAFTLTVLTGAAPVFATADNVTFVAGVGGTFDVDVTGTPTPTLTATGVPAGVTFDPLTGALTVATTAPAGVYPITLTASNGVGAAASQTLTLTIGTPPVSRLAVGGTTAGTAVVYDSGPTGTYNPVQSGTVDPFGIRGINVRTAVADVNGDGTDDIVLVTGPGTAVRFAVVSGTDFRTVLIAPTAPFAGSEGFTGGGFVAAGDLDGDGKAEVVVTPDEGGGPRVAVFSLGSRGPTLRASFAGIDDANFRGGARPALGDVNGDGRFDLVVAAGFGGGPRVAVYNGAGLVNGSVARVVPDFFAFEQTLANGVYVAAGDVNADGFADLILGGGPGGGPRVLVLDGKTLVTQGSAVALGAPVANFFVNNTDATRGGVRVAAKDVPGEPEAAVVVGSGAGEPSRVRVYLGSTVRPGPEPTGFRDLDPFGGVLADGVFVG